MVGTIFGCVHVYVCETYRQEHFSQNQNEVGELDRTFLPSPQMKAARSYSQGDIWGVKRSNQVTTWGEKCLRARRDDRKIKLKLS